MDVSEWKEKKRHQIRFKAFKILTRSRGIRKGKELSWWMPPESDVLGNLLPDKQEQKPEVLNVICQFPCSYSHEGKFQTISMMSPNSELGRGADSL